MWLLCVDLSYQWTGRSGTHTVHTHMKLAPHRHFHSHPGGHKEMSSILADQKRPCNTSPNAWGGRRCGVSANEYSCAHHVTWSTNKLWRSTSIFNLCSHPKNPLVSNIDQFYAYSARLFGLEESIVLERSSCIHAMKTTLQVILVYILSKMVCWGEGGRKRGTIGNL